MMTPCEGCNDPQSLHRSDEQLLALQQRLQAQGEVIHREGGDDNPRLRSVDNKIAVVETVREHAGELACLPAAGCTRSEYLQRALQNLATGSQVSQ